MEQLRTDAGNKYGTKNLADFILSKAGKFISFENGEDASQLSNIFACDNHIEEMKVDWQDVKKAEHGTFFKCALGPYFDTNKHDKSAKYERFINRDESLLMLIHKGIFIRIGTRTSFLF